LYAVLRCAAAAETVHTDAYCKQIAMHFANPGTLLLHVLERKPFQHGVIRLYAE